MLRRLLAVAVLGATLAWAQAPREGAPESLPAQAPAATSCQQDGAQCLKACSATGRSAELMACVRTCEAQVDACRAADAGLR